MRSISPQVHEQCSDLSELYAKVEELEYQLQTAKNIAIEAQKLLSKKLQQSFQVQTEAIICRDGSVLVCTWEHAVSRHTFIRMPIAKSK